MLLAAMPARANAVTAGSSVQQSESDVGAS